MALLDTGISSHIDPDEEDPLLKLEKPHILGCFSVNSNGDYKDSAEKLRYFRMPDTLPLNLNLGYGQAIKKEEFGNERLDSLLKYINRNSDKLFMSNEANNSKAIKDIDFISFGGTFRTLLSTPYEPREDWCISATKFRGNIYLSKTETEQDRIIRENRNDYCKKILSYGFKLQQYCMTENPSIRPNTNVPVDECSRLCCAYKIRLQDFQILLGGKVDGILSPVVCKNVETEEVLNKLNLVEIKCCLRPITELQKIKFYKQRCKDWWCQCILRGTRNLLVGYRDPKGFVDEIVKMDIDSLPQLGTKYWNPSHCTDFLAKFLGMVKDLMKDVNCPYTTYEFHFNVNTKMVSYRVNRENSSNRILPDWYITVLQLL